MAMGRSWVRHQSAIERATQKANNVSEIVKTEGPSQYPNPAMIPFSEKATPIARPISSQGNNKPTITAAA